MSDPAPWEADRVQAYKRRPKLACFQEKGSSPTYLSSNLPLAFRFRWWSVRTLGGPLPVRHQTTSNTTVATISFETFPYNHLFIKNLEATFAENHLSRTPANPAPVKRSNQHKTHHRAPSSPNNTSLLTPGPRLCRQARRYIWCHWPGVRLEETITNYH